MLIKCDDGKCAEIIPSWFEKRVNKFKMQRNEVKALWVLKAQGDSIPLLKSWTVACSQSTVTQLCADVKKK